MNRKIGILLTLTIVATSSICTRTHAMFFIFSTLFRGESQTENYELQNINKQEKKLNNPSEKNKQPGKETYLKILKKKLTLSDMLETEKTFNNLEKEKTNSKKVTPQPHHTSSESVLPKYEKLIVQLNNKKKQTNLPDQALKTIQAKFSYNSKHKKNSCIQLHEHIESNQTKIELGNLEQKFKDLKKEEKSLEEEMID